jgi:hypothetical protein
VNRFKKHISFLLLAVFSLVVLPAPALHEWFSDHTDAADNHCRLYHKDLGCHVEEQQNHCDLFKTNTPLYDAVKVSTEFSIRVYVTIDHLPGKVISLAFSPSPRVPARAPPVA